MVKNLSANPGRPRFHPWVGKIPWRRAWQPTPVFLPGESRGQRSLVGYSPWDHKESDTTEATKRTHTARLVCMHISVYAHLHVCYSQRHQSTAPATEKNPAPNGSNAKDGKLPRPLPATPSLLDPSWLFRSGCPALFCS